MTEKADAASLHELSVFGQIDAGQIAELAALIERLELSMLDCLTLRDLLRLGAVHADAALFAVVAALFAAAAEGSLCLEVSPEALASLLGPGCGPQRAHELAAQFCRRLDQGRYASLIADDPCAYLPLVRVSADGKKRLYFHRYFCHERRLAQRLEAFLEQPRQQPQPPPETIVEALFSPGGCLRERPGGAPLAKDRRQVDAIMCCLQKPFTIISGGPGTGKTSLMVNLVRALVRAGAAPERIYLGAPTGRAAQRMTEAMQQYLSSIREPSEQDLCLAETGGSTLHKMLGYRNARDDFRYNAANPLPADAVVVDEVSMVDVVMMNRLLQAVDPRRTRLILLGDRDQLPSVEAGAVFAGLIPRGEGDHRFREHLVLLEKVYRSGRRLAALAAGINAGRMPERAPLSLQDALRMPADEWCRVAPRGAAEWQRDQDIWLRAQYLAPQAEAASSFRDVTLQAAGRGEDALTGSRQGRRLLTRLFGYVNACRILTLVRGGPFGCEAVNRRLADGVRLAVEGAAGQGRELFSGALVLITRNDYARQLFNGDMGIALRDDEGVCRVYFQRAGAFIGFSRQQLPAWEFGYAVTVHKSQGSEFQDVLLVLPDDANHRLLSREIVYTGVTRARRRVIVYGNDRVLARAVGRRIERTSGLFW